MKKLIYILLPLLTLATSLELPESPLPEPPWDKLGIGIIGASGYNTTFTKNDFLYGLNVLSFNMNMNEEFSEWNTECGYDDWAVYGPDASHYQLYRSSMPSSACGVL